MSKGQTIVRYGSGGQVLEIKNVHTMVFDQESEWDETNTNLIGTKFTVTAHGLVHDALDLLQPQTGPIPSGAEATEIQRFIRHLAMRQRQRFEMIVGADSDGNGGVKLLECDPFTLVSESAPVLSNMDVNNGPRCLSCNVVHVNAQVYHVEFTYEIMKAPECDGQGGNPNNTGILSVTMSVTDDIDRDFMTTRTWEGQIRTATARINPHSFRNFALPRLQFGMRRDKMSFTSSPDGLLLNFRVVDKETYASPPPPATSWAGGGLRTTHTTGDGKKTYVEVSCGLQGDRYANRKKLLSLCVAMVQSRMFAAENEQVNGAEIKTTMELFAVSETLDNDACYVYVSARGHRTVIGNDVNTLLNRSIGVDPKIQTQTGFEENIPQEIFDWDTKLHRGNWKTNVAGPRGDKRGRLPETEGSISVVSALSTHLQTECTSNRSVDFGVVAKKEVLRSRTSPQPAIEEYTEEIPEQLPRTSRVSAAHVSAPYTVWRMEAIYDINQHVVPMPIARFSEESLSATLANSVAHIALCPPTARCTFRVQAVRVGLEPVMPSGATFTDNNTGIVYQSLNQAKRTPPSGQRPAGDREFRDAVDLVYSLSRAPRLNEKLIVGNNPWDLLGTQRSSFIQSSV